MTLSVFLNGCIVNPQGGVIMFRFFFRLAFCLILFQSSFLLAGASQVMTAVNGAGCEYTHRVSTNQIYAKAINPKEMVTCTEPRPQVCTQDYRPVCAMLQDGSFKTYSNGCNACSDPAISGYCKGACE
jgi:hypothetical protein